MINGNKPWSRVYLVSLKCFAALHPISRPSQPAAHECRSTIGASQIGVASVDYRHSRPW